MISSRSGRNHFAKRGPRRTIRGRRGPHFRRTGLPRSLGRDGELSSDPLQGAGERALGEAAAETLMTFAKAQFYADRSFRRILEAQPASRVGRMGNPEALAPGRPRGSRAPGCSGDAPCPARIPGRRSGNQTRFLPFRGHALLGGPAPRGGCPRQIVSPMPWCSNRCRDPAWLSALHRRCPGLVPGGERALREHSGRRGHRPGAVDLPLPGPGPRVRKTSRPGWPGIS